MQNYFTSLEWPVARPKIDYNSQVVLLGSCFAESIGGKFEYFKFRNLINPFGIIFHPRALYGLISRAAENQKFTTDEVFEQQGRWLSLMAHSSLNYNDAAGLVEVLNQRLQALRTGISQASHIFITYGTAYGYRHKATDSIVANCHKLPAADFEKELSTVSELETTLKNTVRMIRSLNDSATLVFTVSPVRHLKDGMVENNRSKAHLLAAVHDLAEWADNLQYFPAYEILLDELRDYRFYDDDMVHPSEIAVDHIWEKFSDCWIDPHSKELQFKIDRIRKDLAHRPFNPESTAHVEFLKKLDQKIAEVRRHLPGILFP